MAGNTTEVLPHADYRMLTIPAGLRTQRLGNA